MSHYLCIDPPSSLAIFNPCSLSSCPYRIIYREERLEKLISHRGNACMKVQKRSSLVENAELANTNSPRRGEGHVFFPVFQILTLPVVLPWLCSAWAPDSRQLSGLWGSHQWGKPDALSLGSWLNTPLFAPSHTNQSEYLTVICWER